MQLDYVESTKCFVLRVPRSEGALIRALIDEHGLDFSAKASTAAQAVLFTREPYAAVPFFKDATPAAAARLLDIHKEIELSWAATSQAHITCPPDEELWPFQKAGVEYALRRNNTLIGDVPGLGKTAQAICYCNEVQAKRVLVICPANIRLQWVKMIRRWSTMAQPYHVSSILKGRHGVDAGAEWIVVSYELARSPATGEALARGKYDVLIIDEAHYLKTIDTHRTRAVFGGGPDRGFPPLASRCGAILGLTGTPLPNRPREAYTLARGLCWDAIDFMSEDRFKDRFNPSVQRESPNGKLYIDERTGRHGELQARLRSGFMVRREKHGERGVMGQLKLPIYEVVQIEEDAPIRRALHAERMLDLDPDHLPGPTDPIFGQIATVRREMGVAIAPHAADYIEMLLLGGEEKIVVFGHHIQVLDILEAKLRRYGVVRIDGRTSPGKKQMLVEQFQTDPSIRLVVGNLLSMGTGTDGLQEIAQRVVFAEADWTPGINQQGVDRLDRGGQEGQVQADFLVAPGSFSERVLATALKKNRTIHEALDRRQ